MKTMQDHTIYCTIEQTKRAYKLGAPIETKLTDTAYNDNYCTLDFDEHSEINLLGKIPTAEQMVGWLEEQCVFIDIENCYDVKGNYTFISIKFNEFGYTEKKKSYLGRKQAILAAIDAALDYLEKGK